MEAEASKGDSRFVTPRPTFSLTTLLATSSLVGTDLANCDRPERDPFFRNKSPSIFLKNVYNISMYQGKHQTYMFLATHVQRASMSSPRAEFLFFKNGAQAPVILSSE